MRKHLETWTHKNRRDYYELRLFRVDTDFEAERSRNDHLIDTLLVPVPDALPANQREAAAKDRAATLFTKWVQELPPNSDESQ